MKQITTTPDFKNRKPAIFRGTRPICAIIVDAEEDFDWIKPVQGTFHSVANMREISTFQDICSAYNAIPTYLLTYPVLEAKDIVFELKSLIALNQCDVGLQLHPWVTPPFETENNRMREDNRLSFAGNLPEEMEQQKIAQLTRMFFSCFEFMPTMYRAGRYGLSQNTLALLESQDIVVDTSVAPYTDFSASGGPDYRAFEFQPFWFGEKSQLLEAPLCRDIVGVLGKVGPMLYRFGASQFGRYAHLHAIFSWLRLAERITLSPEGNDLSALKRLADSLSLKNSQLFLISFHSSSLRKGSNPYVTSDYDSRHFYDRLSGILYYLTKQIDVEFIKLADLPDYYQ